MNTQLPGTISLSYWHIDQDQAQWIQAEIVEESLVGLYVNGQELATIMCSPLDQEALAIGFLFNEGVIRSMDDIGLVKANVPRTAVDVFLNKAEFDPPRRLILTSGCGGGVTFRSLAEKIPPLHSNYMTTPEVLLTLATELKGASRLYNRARGIHTAILGDGDQLILSAEDIGRHNTIDKIAGKALQSNIVLRDHILFSSGRISSEMLNKARQMGIPVIASRTSATSLAVDLARSWDICIVGYVRRGSMRVYTHPQRLGLPETTQINPTVVDHN